MKIETQVLVVNAFLILTIAVSVLVLFWLGAGGKSMWMLLMLFGMQTTRVRKDE